MLMRHGGGEAQGMFAPLKDFFIKNSFVVWDPPLQGETSS